MNRQDKEEQKIAGIRLKKLRIYLGKTQEVLVDDKRWSRLKLPKDSKRLSRWECGEIELINIPKVAVFFYFTKWEFTHPSLNDDKKLYEAFARRWKAKSLKEPIDDLLSACPKKALDTRNLIEEAKESKKVKSEKRVCEPTEKIPTKKQKRANTKVLIIATIFVITLIFGSLEYLPPYKQQERKYVFLAYAKEDFDKVKEIYDGLEKRGLIVLFKKTYLGFGKWQPQIKAALDKSKVLIICISNAATKNHDNHSYGFKDSQLNFVNNYTLSHTPPNPPYYEVKIEELKISEEHCQYDLSEDFEENLDKLAVNLGGFSLSDFSVKDERSKEEKLIEDLMARAGIAYYAYDHKRAIFRYEFIINEHFESTGEKFTSAIEKSLRILAELYTETSRFDKAKEIHEKELDYYDKREDHLNIVITRGNLANVNRALGMQLEAKNQLSEAAEYAKNHGDFSNLNIGRILMNLASLETEMEDFDDAFDHSMEALGLAHGSEDWYNKCRTLGNIGDIYFITGQPAEAEVCYNEALDVCQNAGDTLGEEGVLRQFAAFKRLARGDFPAAYAFLEEAFTKVPDPELCTELALIYCEKGHLEIAHQKSAKDNIRKVNVIFSELKIDGGSGFYDHFQRLMDAQKAFEDGEYNQLFNGEHIDSIYPGLKDWLKNTYPEFSRKIKLQAKTNT